MRLRSPIQYFGGKGNMTAKLLPLFPPHVTYCEPFGGGASMLFRKNPSPVEVYNDIDGTVVNLFRCLQDPAQYKELEHRLRHTLYSRAEYIRTIDLLKDDGGSPVERAWALFVMKNQGFGGSGDSSFGTWGRTFISNNGIADTCNTWNMRLSMLPEFHRRLLGVQIDCNDALTVIKYWDTPTTLFYLDPPYVIETRKARRYTHEMTAAQHAGLIALIQDVQGKVILSGYPHSSYDPLDQAGWTRIEFKTASNAAGRGRNSGLQGEGAVLAKVPRTEVVWMNFDPPVDAVLIQKQMSLLV